MFFYFEFVDIKSIPFYLRDCYRNLIFYIFPITSVYPMSSFTNQVLMFVSQLLVMDFGDLISAGKMSTNDRMPH